MLVVFVDAELVSKVTWCPPVVFVSHWVLHFLGGNFASVCSSFLSLLSLLCLLVVVGVTSGETWTFAAVGIQPLTFFLSGSLEGAGLCFHTVCVVGCKTTSSSACFSNCRYSFPPPASASLRISPRLCHVWTDLVGRFGQSHRVVGPFLNTSPSSPTSGVSEKLRQRR